MTTTSQDNWSVTVSLTAGTTPSGVGQGYLPRGIYQCLTTKVTKDTTEKSEHLNFKALAQVGYVVQEDGSLKHDPRISAQKREITKLIFLMGTEEWQIKQRERDTKAVLVSHAHMTREQATAYGGNLPLNPNYFVQRQCFIAYDPPPAGAGKDDGAEVRWLDQETAQKIISGEAAIAWPWDNKQPKGDSEKALGGAPAQSAAGAMLPTGLPQAALPSAVPMPRPAAAAPAAAPMAAPTAPMGAPAFAGFQGAPAASPAVPAPNGVQGFAGFTPGAPQQWGAPQS